MVDDTETLALTDPQEWPASLPADEVIKLARALNLKTVKGVNLPKPEGLPRGWYELRTVNKRGGRRLYWRWATDPQTRPDALCPCGSGRKFQRCCMVVKTKSLGRLT